MNRLVCALMVVMVAAFASCKKIDLNEQIPGLKGSWRWKESGLGGTIGTVYADTTLNLVLTFEDNNKISIDFNDESIVQSETYTVSKSDNSFYGDYMITLPNKVKTYVFKRLGVTEGSLILDGYVFIYDIKTISGSHIYQLGITDKKEIDVGIEGYNYHKCSIYEPLHEIN